MTVINYSTCLLDALLGHTDGMGQQGIDAWVLTELCREGCPAGRAGALALVDHPFETAQAVVVLARPLQGRRSCG